jgi:hypothetical protein
MNVAGVVLPDIMLCSREPHGRTAGARRPALDVAIELQIRVHKHCHEEHARRYPPLPVCDVE